MERRRREIEIWSKEISLYQIISLTDRVKTIPGDVQIGSNIILSKGVKLPSDLFWNHKSLYRGMLKHIFINKGSRKEIHYMRKLVEESFKSRNFHLRTVNITKLDSIIVDQALFCTPKNSLYFGISHQRIIFDLTARCVGILNLKEFILNQKNLSRILWLSQSVQKLNFSSCLIFSSDFIPVVNKSVKEILLYFCHDQFKGFDFKRSQLYSLLEYFTDSCLACGKINVQTLLSYKKVKERPLKEKHWKFQQTNSAYYSLTKESGEGRFCTIQ
ncbi:unnamed protein product [Moneuplotes crassus]|uniref:Uncharacterized protein n=1 Tax=Euplotes crassus TaxID=5936 RepID=A0AAD2D021_EUPCR|nr:unnamed protein product [Moneuplotes crassus]